MNLDESLHGKYFEDLAALAQGLKFAFRRGKNWEALQPESKEALELIASSLAQILTGDASDVKRWADISLLADLRRKALEGSLEKSIAQTAQARVINPKNLFDPAPRPLGDA
jgi:hypothetical protein